MIDAGGTLILVESTAPLIEGDQTLVGMMRTRERRQINIQNDAAEHLGLEGPFAEAYFMLGYPDVISVVSFYITLGIPAFFGMFGVFRYAQRRVADAREVQSA